MIPDKHEWTTTTHTSHGEVHRVVAVVNRVGGEIFSWAAYLGRTDDPDETAGYGDKVSAKTAFALFPELPQERWRS